MNATLQNVIKLAKELDRKDKTTADKGGEPTGGPAKAKSRKLALSPELTRRLQESGVLQKLLDLRTRVRPDIPEKSAWTKSAQLALDKLNFNPQAMMADTKDRLAEFWASVSPETKRTLLNSAIGALVGGGLGGAAGGYYAGPGEGLSQMISKGMLGSLLGGAAAGLGTAGYQAATSGRVLPGEERGFSPVDRLANTVVGGMVHNPATTAGTGLGLWSGVRGAGNVLDAAATQATRRKVFADSSTLAEAFLNNPRLLGQLIAESRTGFTGGMQLLGLPAGIGMGWLIDRYLKGKND